MYIFSLFFIRTPSVASRLLERSRKTTRLNEACEGKIWTEYESNFKQEVQQPKKKPPKTTVEYNIWQLSRDTQCPRGGSCAAKSQKSTPWSNFGSTHIHIHTRTHTHASSLCGALKCKCNAVNVNVNCKPAGSTRHPGCNKNNNNNNSNRRIQLFVLARARQAITG